MTDEAASEASPASPEHGKGASKASTESPGASEASTTPPGASEASSEPVLHVVQRDATPEEIAALVAVFASLGGGDEPAAPRSTPEWSAHHRKVRATHPHGPGGWRSSGLPR